MKALTQEWNQADGKLQPFALTQCALTETASKWALDSIFSAVVGTEVQFGDMDVCRQNQNLWRPPSLQS